MSVMMAQASNGGPSFLDMLSWSGWVATVVMAVIAYLSYKRKKETREIKPDPLNVRMAVEFVREKDCLSRHAESTRGVEEVKAQLAELRLQRIQDAKDAGASREKMYQKMEQFRLEVSTHVEGVRKELSEKIDDMPERVIATLKNTGAI